MEREKEFEKLVREHRRTIYTVCYMFSKDSDEVEDMFQEILIRLWNGFGSFRGESGTGTWVWRVSLNSCLNQTGRKQRRGVPLKLESDPWMDNDPDSAQIRQLHRRISRLGPVDRAIILLWLENMSYAEIGEIVGISAGNVSVKLVRIRERLRAMGQEKD